MTVLMSPRRPEHSGRQHVIVSPTVLTVEARIVMKLRWGRSEHTAKRQKRLDMQHNAEIGSLQIEHQYDVIGLEK